MIMFHALRMCLTWSVFLFFFFLLTSGGSDLNRWYGDLWIWREMIMKASSYSMIRVFSESRVKSPVKQATSLCPYGDGCPMTTDQWYPGGHIGGLSPGTVDYTNFLQRQTKCILWIWAQPWKYLFLSWNLTDTYTWYKVWLEAIP